MHNNHYDCIIIGAGMSGLAAGIRLAMYNKKVLILEKHSIAGGLNSYYARGKRKFDVGLHALTNYVSKTERGRPLNKLLKQLRIPYDELKLHPQHYSLIQFPEHQLKFTNDIEFLIEEISHHFPSDVDGFNRLIEHIKNFDEVNLNNEHIPAKDVVRTFIKNESLLEMIFCPLLIYGSAWENDMDFSQFVIMFKSLFFEGFARPEGGVRTIIDLLLKKCDETGVEVRFKSRVDEIKTQDGKVQGVLVNKTDFISCECILSSMGLPETYAVLKNDHSESPRVGNLSFTETILMTDKKPRDLGIDATIIFYNNRPEYQYRRPDTLIDPMSAVICFPNNFSVDEFDEGIMRITNIANHERWLKLRCDPVLYKNQKEVVYNESLALIRKCSLKNDFNVQFSDVFTPATIERFTGHFGGTVYGSIDKSRNGKTKVEGLYVCGTDQGFLGIVGSMLSGISMANLHVLSGSI